MLKIKLVEGSDVNSQTLKIKLDNSVLSKEDVTPKQKPVEIKQTITDTEQPLKLCVGNCVRHKEEPIVGTVKFVGKENVSIVWEDNTRERMALATAMEDLELVDNYVDSVQSEVAPLSSQMGDNDEVSQDEKMDLEKIKLQRKINQLENKKVKNITSDLKEKLAKELVDIMVDKEMIEEDDADLEIQKILMMDDEQYEAKKAEILEFQNDYAVSSKKMDAPEEVNLTEAEKMLKRIKGNGGRGVIGDFSKHTGGGSGAVSRPSMPSMPSTPSSSSERRSLSDLQADRQASLSGGFNENAITDAIISNLEVGLSDLANNPFSKVARQQAQTEQFEQQQRKELPGFENLQGLKKPIVVSSKATNFPSNTNIKDLISGLNWTTTSKVH